MPGSRRTPHLARGGVRIWAPFLLLAVTGACVALSIRARPLPVPVKHAVAKSAGDWKGLQMEADTSRLDDHHLWIIIRVPAGQRQPARTIRYDAYRQVLSHYGEARKIPLSFTLAPPIAGTGAGL